LPKEDEILPQKLREETRALFLQRRSRQLLDNNELKALWVLLDKHHSPPLSGDEQLINYEDFKKVGKLAGAKCSPYFTAVVFAKLQQGDPHGRISIMALFNYVMRKVWLHQTRIGLSLYDVTGQGFLRESVYLYKYISLQRSDFIVLLFVYLNVFIGFGELYLGINTDIATIGRSRKIFPFVLCMYSCQKIFIFLGSSSDGTSTYTGYPCVQLS